MGDETLDPMTAPKRKVKKAERLKGRTLKKYSKGKPTGVLYERYMDAARDTGMSGEQARSAFVHDLPPLQRPPPLQPPPPQRIRMPSTPLEASPARALPREERASGVRKLIEAGKSGEALLQSSRSESEQDISAKWMELREEKAAQMREAAQRRDDAMLGRMNSNPGFEKYLTQEAIRTGQPRQRFANEAEYAKAAHQYEMMQELSRSMRSMPYGGL